jgi:hypothetical protein
MYCRLESFLLKKYEAKLVNKVQAFWSVTEKDAETYRHKFGCKQIQFLPLYLPSNWKIKLPESMGMYCLYQGDLSVEANVKAAEWLLTKVFNQLEIPFVIAGKNPPKKLAHLAHKHTHTCLVANPGEAEMQDMIAKAQINILPSTSNTGIKIKLLNALYNGRHCLVNSNTAMGSGVEQLCHTANNAEAFINTIRQLFQTPYNAKMAMERTAVLMHQFNNQSNAKQQVEWIWGK